jgi:O-acetyl-ADP-ribose deacetylase (regulator of RNase III)
MKIVQGDLIEMAKNRDFDVIIHGCNCFKTMESGIAVLIKDAFPEALAADRATVSGNPRKLGTVSVALVDAKDGTPPLIIVNAYTQFKYWRDKDNGLVTPLVDYLAVKEAFAEIREKFGRQNFRFGFPKIGAGLAGGDWNIISGIIDFEMIGEDITLVELVG